jgi:hypothetical protein
MDLSGLLSALDKAHLSDLVAEDTVASWCTLLDGKNGRPTLLGHLKNAGMDKLSDRQGVVNGFCKARREGKLAGAPPMASAPSTEPPKTMVPPVQAPRAPPSVRKGRILCLHGGGSSGPILKVQMSRILQLMGNDYEFHFANGPSTMVVDPNSPNGKVLSHFFEGLPVLRWMDIVEKSTGRSANVVGGMAPSSKTDRHGKSVDLLQEIDRIDAKKAGSASPDGAAPSGGETLVAAAATAPAAAPTVLLTELTGETFTYSEAGAALRTLAQFVRTHGPFDGAFGFSQGANLLAIWLSLVEAGVLEAGWARPKWACLCCATQWGWGGNFDDKAAELAAAIGPSLGARSPEELRALAGQSGAALERLDRLMTCAPLSIPSLHWIGEKDPARPASEANIPYYEEARRVVMVHPNDHMPPRQKEFAEALAEFAERWSSTPRAHATAAVPIA